MKDYSDPLAKLDPLKLQNVAAAIALNCLPGSQTPDWKKSRIYYEALQLAWVTEGDERGKKMLAELKALKRLGEYEAEEQAVITVIKKYHAMAFPNT